MNIADKLSAIRAKMQQANLDYYYVPSSDDHHNEYLAPHFERRAFMSGFTGSAGDVLIGNDAAYLWTDPRYFLQAEQQLDKKCFQLMRQKQGMAAPIHQWLEHNAAGKRVGVDPKTISITMAKRWQRCLDEVDGQLISIEDNFVDSIWQDQPAFKHSQTSIWDKQYAGLSAKEKIAQVRNAYQKLNADAHIVTMLDAIAWLFNIRGNDIPYNPVMTSYAIITDNKAMLFIDPQSVTEELEKHCQQQGIELHDYQDVATAIHQLTGNVLIEAATANLWVSQQLKQAKPIYEASPITLMKAIKNSTEVAGMFEAHRRDALSMCRFLHWLDHHWQGQSELSVIAKAEEFRRQDKYCQELSFSTICGYAEHGAIIHYFATKDSSIGITDKNLLLIDSGGQYLQGTTDITRTVHLGQPSDEHKHYYTLVLKGHLALRHLNFPDGVNGEHINAVAHLHLWKEGLDYGHGTGHGVGCYLNVHEGPQRIAWAATTTPLQENMVVSNEPGCYLENKFGIRIENLCVIKKVRDEKDSATGHGPFYQLQDLTLVPYARKLIDLSLLNQEEIQWIDDYHQHIYNTLADDLNGDVKAWLKEATLPLS